MKKNNETPPPLLTGKISAHRDGYGFFVPNDGSEDLFIHSTEMRKVFDGDEVTARILRKDKRGKIEGEIVSVVAHNTRRVTGKLFREAKQWRVIPSNPKMQHTVFIEQPFTINANHEDIVVVEITRQPDRYRPPAGIITEVLGQEMAPGMEIEIAIRNFGIPFEWPAQVEQEAGKLAPEPTTRDKANGQMDFLLAPDFAQRFSAEGTSAVEAASGKLDRAAVNGEDAGTAIALSQSSSAAIEAEVARLEARLKLIIYTGGLAAVEANVPEFATRLMDEGLGRYMLVKD